MQRTEKTNRMTLAFGGCWVGVEITCNMFPEHCNCSKLVLPAVQAWSIGGAGVLWCGWKSAGIPQWLNSGGRRCLVWDVGDEGEDAGVERVTGRVWGKAERAELGWEGAEGMGVIGVERAVDISRPSETIRLWNWEESLRGRARTPQEPWEMSSSLPSGSSLRSALEISILDRRWGCLCEYVLSVRCPTEDGGVRGGCGDGGDGGKASSEVGSRLGSSSRLERVSADNRPLSRSTTPPGMLRQSTASTGPSSTIPLRHARDSGYEPMACRTRTSSSASSEVGNSSLFLPVITKQTWIIEYQMTVNRQTKQVDRKTEKTMEARFRHWIKKRLLLFNRTILNFSHRIVQLQVIKSKLQDKVRIARYKLITNKYTFRVYISQLWLFNLQLRVCITQLWKKSLNCEVKSHNYLLKIVFSGRNGLP